MTILSVGFPLLLVGPDSGGGAEQILYLVEQGIVAAGHRSIVVAPRGSQICGELLETPAAPEEITDDVRARAQNAHAEEIRDALTRFPIDLIHFHGLDFYAYLPERDVPMLATLHLPAAWYPRRIFEQYRVFLNCVSESQAASVPCARKPPVIINGIDVKPYGEGAASKDFLLVLGRVCPEKGIDIALAVARRLDLPLMIAGPVHPFRYHEHYFATKVKPLLDGQRQYIGPIGVKEKTSLLAAARAVLIPSLVAETSSLVAMEAMAAGTPVVAFRSGALPEIVQHGETGFIVDSADEMAEAVKRAGEIAPEKCRLRAELHFGAARMVRDYLRLYAAVLQKQSSSCASGSSGISG